MNKSFSPNAKLQYLDVLNPPRREVDNTLTDIVGDVLRDYILEDELKDDALDVMMNIAEMLCLNIESVKLDIVEKGLFASWSENIAGTLNDHAISEQEAYSNIAYLRTDVTLSKPWALFMIIVICRHFQEKASRVSLDFTYLLRFCENILSSIFSNIAAQRP